MVKDTIIEAAKIDGAGEMRIFWTIVMPMVKARMADPYSFLLQGLWNATGSTYIYTEQLKTLNYAISQIISGYFPSRCRRRLGGVFDDTALLPCLCSHRVT